MLGIKLSDNRAFFGGEFLREYRKEERGLVCLQANSERQRLTEFLKFHESGQIQRLPGQRRRNQRQEFLLIPRLKKIRGVRLCCGLF